MRCTSNVSKEREKRERIYNLHSPPLHYWCTSQTPAEGPAEVEIPLLFLTASTTRPIIEAATVGLRTQKRSLTRQFYRRHATASNEMARVPGYPNLQLGQPQGYRHPSKGSRAAWCGTWGTFADGRSSVSMLARKLEKELRRRYQVNGDLVLGAVAHQAARHAALAEALADEMLEGPTEGRRRAQERWASATRNYRKALDLLAASAGRPGRESGVTLEQIKKRYATP